MTEPKKPKKVATPKPADVEPVDLLKNTDDSISYDKYIQTTFGTDVYHSYVTYLHFAEEHWEEDGTHHYKKLTKEEALTKALKQYKKWEK